MMEILLRLWSGSTSLNSLSLPVPIPWSTSLLRPLSGPTSPARPCCHTSVQDNCIFSHPVDISPHHSHLDPKWMRCSSLRSNFPCCTTLLLNWRSKIQSPSCSPLCIPHPTGWSSKRPGSCAFGAFLGEWPRLDLPHRQPKQHLSFKQTPTSWTNQPSSQSISLTSWNNILFSKNLPLQTSLCISQSSFDPLFPLHLYNSQSEQINSYLYSVSP